MREPKARKNADGDFDSTGANRATLAHVLRTFAVLSVEEARNAFSSGEADKLQEEGLTFRAGAADDGLNEAEEQMFESVSL